MCACVCVWGGIHVPILKQQLLLLQFEGVGFCVRAEVKVNMCTVLFGVTLVILCVCLRIKSVLTSLPSLWFVLTV